MATIQSVKQDLLAECEEDHIGLWSVVKEVADSIPTTDEAVLRHQVLTLLFDLLRSRKIKAGFPTESGGFRPFRAAPFKVILRIEKEWPAGRRPKIGEGLWFTSAKKASSRSSDA